MEHRTGLLDHLRQARRVEIWVSLFLHISDSYARFLPYEARRDLSEICKKETGKKHQALGSEGRPYTQEDLNTSTRKPKRS